MTSKENETDIITRKGDIWSENILTNEQPTARTLSKAFNVSQKCSTSDFSFTTHDDWQRVGGKDTCVYSAHVDPRLDNVSIVRVFGIMEWNELFNSSFREPYYCQVHLLEERCTYFVEAEINTFGSLAYRKPVRFKSMEFKCILNVNPWIRLPISISIVTDPCSGATNFLAPSQHYLDGYQTNFSVCLHGALKANFSSHSDLVQWLELNSILGAERAYIYNYTGHTTLKPYLEYYMSKGFLMLLPYHLPLDLKDKNGLHWDYGMVWNYAQDVIIQDCLYRNLMVSKRLALVDVDEFIIPSGKDIWTWRDMLEKANCNNRTAVYVIRNVMFPTNLAPSVNNRNEEKRFRLSVLFFDRRLSEINPPFFRSKLIVIPDQVVFVGIHSPGTSWQRVVSHCIMDTGDALLHHYRDMTKLLGSDEEMMEQLVKDKTAYKYSSELVDRVKRVYDIVEKIDK